MVSSYRADTIVTETATYKVQRGITLNIYIQELWFLCFARYLMLVNISMKFHEDILNGFKLQSGHNFVTETAFYKVKRGITKKIYIQELWFLQSAHRSSNVG